MVYTVKYIGLPDMQYRDVTVSAENEEEARDLADYFLLCKYGRDDFDCLSVECFGEINLN